MPDLHQLADQALSNATSWADAGDTDQAEAWDALHTLTLIGGAAVERLAATAPALVPNATRDVTDAVRRLSEHLTAPPATTTEESAR